MSEQLTEPAEVIPLRDPDKPVIFISHRHEDRAIADVLREFIDARTGGAVTVHQSSSPDAAHPKPGTNLTQGLRSILWDASVVVLLYTTRDQDWSYCMWECGVAQLPEPSDTKIIVLKVADDSPEVFGERLHVGLRLEEDIEKFVNDLLTDPEYFPKMGRAVTSFNPGAHQVKDAAKALHAGLQEVLPVIDDTGEEWPPYPQFTLELTDDQTARICEASGAAADRLEVARRIVTEEALVTGGDGQVGRIFSARGFPRSPEMRGVPMRSLIAGWTDNTPTPTSKWLDGMCRQILSTVQGQFPSPTWELMRGADRQDGTWYGPLVRYVKRVPARKVSEIDVVFCKFNLDDQGRLKLSVPPVEEEE